MKKESRYLVASAGHYLCYKDVYHESSYIYMNYYFIKYLPVRIKRFRASPLHEL